MPFPPQLVDFEGIAPGKYQPFPMGIPTERSILPWETSGWEVQHTEMAEDSEEVEGFFFSGRRKAAAKKMFFLRKRKKTHYHLVKL